MLSVLYFLLPFVLYFLYQKVLLMYYKYFYYTRQGMPATAFPLPLVGTLHKVLKYFLNVSEYQEPPVIEFYNQVFKEGIPPAFISFMNIQSTVVLNDPEMVSEAFVAKNKFLDKDAKFQRIQYRLLGDSILFQPSNELWAHKRKILSQAFYKDKLTKILQIAISTILDYQAQSLDKMSPKKAVNLYQVSSHLVQNSIQACVFGLRELERTVAFEEHGGQRKQLKVGDFLGHLVKQQVKFIMMPHRMFFDAFDDVYWGKNEKTLLGNIVRFREFIQERINERRLEMKDPKFVEENHDFLTLLLQEELFAQSDSMMIDECITFLLAGTQTSTFTLCNNLDNITRHGECREKVLSELQSVSLPNIQGRPTYEQWTTGLTQETIGDLHYLGCFLSETLRMHTPGVTSMPFLFTEEVTLGGFRILKGNPCMVNVWALQHDPKQWQRPHDFLPERFDPSSPYFSAPHGGKRHPTSFCPFMGGKRICLGKTFAELLGKILLSMTTWNYSFEYEKDEHYERKPLVTIGLHDPVLMVKVHKRL